MEAQDEVTTLGVEPISTKEEDHQNQNQNQAGAHMIIKGKRTKRQRPQSPIPFLVHSSSATGDGSGLGLGSPTNTSPPASSGEFPATSATEEEEDMANCLILLAQGQSRQPVQVVHHDAAAAVYSYKVPVSNSTKLGLYVYECKTCSRTFPSFQALGGHRASHKKPKLAAAAAQEKRRLQLSEEKEYFGQFRSSFNSPRSLSLQLSSRAMQANNNNNRNKLHECSVCGAEFSSGQALGGHMRRHRGMLPPTTAATPSAAAATTLSLMSPVALDQTDQELTSNNNNNNDNSNGDHYNKSSAGIGGAGGLSLSLDLNLPAPEDERESDKFGFPSKQQQEQSHLVFPTPTLVDCQY